MRVNMNENNRLNKTIPEELVNYYSQKINESFVSQGNLSDFNIEYEYDDKTELIMNVSPFTMNGRFKVPDNMPEDVQNLEDFERFLYNSQTTIEINNNNVPFVEINGVEIPLENLFLDKNGEPLKDIEMEMFPSPFDKKDKLEINLEVDNEKRNLVLIRKPHNSVNTKLYENDQHSDLFIFSIKIYGKEVEFSLVSKLDGLTCIKDIVFVNKLLIAFHKKKLIINNISMKSLFSNNDTVMDLDENEIRDRIILWENMKKVEKLLNEEFKVKFPLNNEEVTLMNELLVSLILNKPFKDRIKVDSINLNVENPEILDDAMSQMYSLKDKKEIIVIGGQLEREIELFETLFQLYDNYLISNVIITEVIAYKEDMKVEVLLERVSKDTSFVTRQLALNKKENIKKDDKFKEALYIDVYKENLFDLLSKIEE